MFSIRKHLSLIGAGALTLGMVSGAGAQLVQTQNFGSTGSPLTLPINQSLTFNQFNPLLGTLNSVDVLLSGSVNVSATVNNSGLATEHYTSLQVGAGLDLENNAGKILASPNINVFFVSTSTAIGAGAHQTYGPQLVTQSDSNLYTVADGATFSKFIGAGTIPLTLLVSNDDILSGDVNVTATPTSTGYGFGQVTYNFTPLATSTPEPGVFALLTGLGATGVFALRRRRAR